MDVGDNQIVLLTRVTAAEWAPRSTSAPVRLSEVDDNHLYDTVVTLVDVRTGQTLATRRLPQKYMHTVSGGQGLMYGTASDDLGHVVTSILRIQTR